MSKKKKIGFRASTEDPEENPKKKEKSEDDIRMDELADELLSAFCERFLPASSLENSTNQFSTLEVFGSICKFCPKTDISFQKITIALLEREYKYVITQNNNKLEYKWLVQEKL